MAFHHTNSHPRDRPGQQHNLRRCNLGRVDPVALPQKFLEFLNEAESNWVDGIHPGEIMTLDTPS
jgi:hypothetical protein